MPSTRNQFWHYAFLRISKDRTLRLPCQSQAAVAQLVPCQGSMTNKTSELHLHLARAGILLPELFFMFSTSYADRTTLGWAPYGLPWLAQPYHLHWAWQDVACGFCCCCQLMPEHQNHACSAAQVICGSTACSVSKFWLTEWLLVCIERLIDHTCLTQR